jgi:predicted transcriptional regulator of viral defense system
MPGAAFNVLAELAADRHGYLTQEDAERAGVGKWTLARMAERGTLERVSHGVYRMPFIAPGPLDEYMQATLWTRGARGVISHQSALELHGLSDVNPAKIHLTVPVSHRIQRTAPALYHLHHAEVPAAELTAIEDIPIVTPARAIRDCHAAGLGPALIDQAIHDGRRQGILSAAQARQLRSETRPRDAG